MLRSAEVTAVLTGLVPGEGFHNLHWQGSLAMSLDCFVCERVGRTTSFELGAERAVCSSSTHDGTHYTAARIAAFDHTTGQDTLSLRAIVDFWWAPFHDAKDNNLRATPLTRSPWVRLHLGYYCPHSTESGEFSIQSNVVRPSTENCRNCEVTLATSSEAPTIRLLG